MDTINWAVLYLQKTSRVRSRTNSGQIRVKNREVSEVEPISDKEEQKTRSCPKLEELRTKKSEKAKVLSEVEETSDKEEWKNQVRVWSRANFGHQHSKTVPIRL